jgi:HSP20 family protein
MNGLSTRFSQALRPLLTRDPFENLQQEIEGLITRFKADGNGDWPASMITPSVDLAEKDDSIEIRMDVPGMKPEEIDIQVTGNTISISGEHQEEKEEKGKTFHRLERRSGAFSRSFALPAAVKEGSVTAECKNGVLTVKLPKTEVAKSRAVKVIAK